MRRCWCWFIDVAATFRLRSTERRGMSDARLSPERDLKVAATKVAATASGRKSEPTDPPMYYFGAASFGCYGGNYFTNCQSKPCSGCPRAAEFYHCRVREHHVRVALESFIVMPGKFFAGLRHNQQEVRLAHQGLNLGQCQRFFRVQGFVHGDDEL